MIKKLIEHMGEQLATSEKQLCKLLDSLNPENMLVVMVAQLLIRPATSDVGDEFGTNAALVELLAYYAYPKFNNSQSRAITPMDTGECHELLETILRSKHFAGIDADKEHLLSSPSELLKMHSEIVRGNAYPEQTAGKIAQIQGRFDRWFVHKVGLSPSRAVDIIFHLVKHAEEAIADALPKLREAGEEFSIEWEPQKEVKVIDASGEEACVSFKNREDANAFGFFTKYNERIPEIFPISLQELPISPSITIDEEIGLKSLISFSTDKLDEVEKAEDIRKFPLFELSDGRVILSDFSNTMDFLWEAFDDIAKSDQRFFDRRYQKAKSKWVEDKAVDYLHRLFPKETVYQTLDYPDSTKPDGGTAELDIAVVWEPFLILIEVKAKQFRLESQTGNSAKLRTDLKANIEDAYKQSLRAINYIEESDPAVFVERYTGRKLLIDRGDFFKIFPVSLSLHQLSGISTQLKKTQQLGLFLDGNYPFSICLSEFDLITRTRISPDVLLHYIERRLSVLGSYEEYHGDELDLFSAYLDTRLHRNNLIKPSEKMNMIAFTGYSENFDKLMMYDRGDYPNKPDIRLNVPEEVENIFTELGSRRDPSSRRISFALLELENDMINSIAKGVSELKTQTISNGIFRRVTFGNEEIVISIVAANPSSFSELGEKTKFRTFAEKYRRKVEKSIGIGILCQNNKLSFEMAQYIEFPWEQDDDMDIVLETEPPFVPTPDTKLPGVNQPCICGSGKKFKKCCKRKIEDSRRNYSFQ